MTAREQIHKLVDALPEQKLPQLREIIEELTSEDGSLSEKTREAIREGLDDIQRGDTISVEEYRRTRGL